MSEHILIVGDNERMWDDFLGKRNAGGELTGGRLDGLPEHVDCVITSPPYKDEDGFSIFNIRSVAQTLAHILRGPAWVNFGDLTGQMERAPSVAAAFEMEEFVWEQTVIWAKSLNGRGQYTPFPKTAKRFNSHHEYIYLIYPRAREDDFRLDRLAIGEPYTDKANVKRFNHAADLRCPGTIWFMPYVTIQSKGEKAHKNRFPLELPDRCLKASALREGAWVLDPYAGSGTVALAAENLGFNSVSYERDASMVKVFRERLPNVEVVE